MAATGAHLGHQLGHVVLFSSVIFPLLYHRPRFHEGRDCVSARGTLPFRRETLTSLYLRSESIKYGSFYLPVRVLGVGGVNQVTQVKCLAPRQAVSVLFLSWTLPPASGP